MTRPTETDRAKTDRDRGIGSAAWMFAGKSAVDSVSSFASATENLLYLGFFAWCAWRFRIGERVFEGPWTLKDLDDVTAEMKKRGTPQYLIDIAIAQMRK